VAKAQAVVRMCDNPLRFQQYGSRVLVLTTQVDCMDSPKTTSRTGRLKRVLQSEGCRAFTPHALPPHNRHLAQWRKAQALGLDGRSCPPPLHAIVVPPLRWTLLHPQNSRSASVNRRRGWRTFGRRETGSSTATPRPVGRLTWRIAGEAIQCQNAEASDLRLGFAPLVAAMR